MTDGKAFAIIVKVVKRKSEKQKHALLDWSILSKTRNCFSRRNFVVFPFYHATNRENTHTGFYTLGKINE